MLAAGAKKELKDEWGETPLTLAKQEGHAEVVALLR